MKTTLLGFSDQLKWQPTVEGGVIPSAGRYLLCGMGGSALAGGLLAACDQTIPLAVHRDYGLPPLIKSDSVTPPLIIISSFSGNTEETLDAYQTARAADWPLVVVTAGGELLASARRAGVPLIVLPDPAIPPRLAVGYFLRALALITGAGRVGRELESLAPTLDLAATETDGRSIAKRLTGRIPLFYSSNCYAPLAYFWKIMLNETAKIPAFSNMVPEQNHNELESLGHISANPFTVVMLTSADDQPRIAKRFNVLTEILPSLRIPVETILLAGASPAARVVNSILLASFTTLALAEARSVDPDNAPVIEDFKHRLSSL